MFFSVEGTWSAWGAWGTCSTTCNSGSRTRTRSFTGGQPCTGSSSDTGNCDSKLDKTLIFEIAISHPYWEYKVNIWRGKWGRNVIASCFWALNVFQLKEHGQAGITGVHAQELAIQTQELGQCSTMAICRAVAYQVKQETVKVNIYILKLAYTMSS